VEHGITLGREIAPQCDRAAADGCQFTPTFRDASGQDPILEIIDLVFDCIDHRRHAIEQAVDQAGQKLTFVARTETGLQGIAQLKDSAHRPASKGHDQTFADPDADRNHVFQRVTFVKIDPAENDQKAVLYSNDAGANFIIEQRTGDSRIHGSMLSDEFSNFF
jgi:hypothetical protein